MVNVKIKLCGGMIPVKRHKGEACYDLLAPQTMTVKASRQTVPLGFMLQLPFQYCAHILPVSNAVDSGLRAYLSCDTDFEHPVHVDVFTFQDVVSFCQTGEVSVSFTCSGRIIKSSCDDWVSNIINVHSPENHDDPWDGTLVIREGEPIARMAILPVPDTTFEEVDEIEERGTSAT